VNSDDAAKVDNFGENIAIIRSGQSFIVEKRNTVTANDTIFIGLSNMKQAAYQFKFFPTSLTGVTAVLEDAYLNTSTPINLNAESTFNFTIDANAASSGNRFRIVMRPSGALPISFTGITAQEKNGNVEVSWNVSNEMNIADYSVEKSIDGRNFSLAATVPVNTSGSIVKNYQWLDVNAVNGVNYYRVKSNGLNDVKYTAIVKVTIGKKTPGVAIYPNPVRGNNVSLQLSDLQKGNYELKVFNTTGQLISVQKIQYNGGSTMQTITLPSGISKGMYRLTVKGNDTMLNQTFVVE
jgi:hypothetical protein